ncbi:MAG TPA: hypothetical protein VJ476_12730 [Rhizomicrobium sp.]|nr:hypothetical protein [Rhizomicrobium sp.]
MAGYSGTPLDRKLGLKLGMSALPLNAPKNYRALVGGDANFVTKVPKGGADFVHLFVASCVELDRLLPRARQAMKTDGMLWVSWYKKAAKIPTDVTEDTIRNRALKGDLVDVKVCAVDETWSGLKLVVRKHLR